MKLETYKNKLENKSFKELYSIWQDYYQDRHYIIQTLEEINKEVAKDLMVRMILGDFEEEILYNL